MNCFFDTNVIVYAYDPRAGVKHSRAHALIERHAAKGETPVASACRTIAGGNLPSAMPANSGIGVGVSPQLRSSVGSSMSAMRADAMSTYGIVILMKILELAAA